MADEPIERSKAGDPIHRHTERKIPFEISVGDGEMIEAVDAHIQRWIGPVDNVWHEIISDLVHIDVHVVAPTPERNFYTLITSGMSEVPMTTPEGLEELAYAELLICLPPDWPMTQADFKDERNYWPLRGLKFLARLPHEYDTWLWEGHTVPNGDPAEPFAAGTNYCCFVLLPPLLCPDEFRELKINDQKTVYFHAVVPLYREEMQYKLDHGLDELLKKFANIDASELLNLQRPNVCKQKPWWKFWG